jgi:hypothetical protein
MQEDDTTKNEVVEEVVADEPQTIEPQAEEEQQEQVDEEVVDNSEEPTEEEQPKEETPEDKPPSRREQLRIQQLLQKYGDPRQKQQQQAPSQRQDVLDYGQALDADEEVVKTLESDRTQYGQAQYNEGLKRAEYLDWKTSLKIEAPVIEKKYPILDPNSPDFHPAVADAMNTWYLKMSGFDPNTQTVSSSDISYADFVESNMELVEEIAGQRNAQTVKNVAKQTAQTGLRPDGSSAPRMNLNKAPQEMTMDELYASIGQKNPHKK